MKRYPVEFIGKTAEKPRCFSKTKKIDCIFFQSLSNKKIIKRAYLNMPFKSGNYDYTKDIQELFLTNLQIKVKFVSRETLKKSKTFIYHIYLFN